MRNREIVVNRAEAREKLTKLMDALRSFDKRVLGVASRKRILAPKLGAFRSHCRAIY